MDLAQRVEAFIKLGKEISRTSNTEMDELSISAYNQNNWFTRESINKAFEGLSTYLSAENLSQWLANYNLKADNPKNIGVIMAGNIPMVGFHDLLSVLIAGHKLMIKPSSQDSVLMNYVISKLIEVEPAFEDKIQTVERLNEADAFIGTGSDNSAKYFKQYFAKKPHIIRKNRTAVAVITGRESKDELETLGEDVFTYFGLGCRNVSKLFVPKGYNFMKLLDAQSQYAAVGDHHKYRNNYDYNKSIYLVNTEPHLDTGFSLLRKSDEMVSPISVLFYQEYDTQEQLNSLLADNKDKIQCVIGHDYIPFGNAQNPELWDYADGVDTLDFLSRL